MPSFLQDLLGSSIYFSHLTSEERILREAGRVTKLVRPHSKFRIQVPSQA